MFPCQKKNEPASINIQASTHIWGYYSINFCFTQSISDVSLISPPWLSYFFFIPVVNFLDHTVYGKVVS